MLNGNGKLSIVNAINVFWRDRHVLLRTNTQSVEDELHTRSPLLLKTKLTSILPIIYVRSMG